MSPASASDPSAIVVNAAATGTPLVHVDHLSKEFPAGATAVFGGFTPAICTYLIHATGNRAMPGAWLSAAAACSLISTVLLSRARIASWNTPAPVAAQATS